MLSMNMASTADMTINVRKMGTVRYFTALAKVMHIQRKKPALAMPSTIIIIPAMNRMVDQLMPLALSLPGPSSYQKDRLRNWCRFRVSRAAGTLCMARPKTKSRVAQPHSSVTVCLWNLSRMMSRNMTRKILTARV